MSSIGNACIEADTTIHHEKRLLGLQTLAPVFKLVRPDDSEREQVEALVAEKFHAAWGAHITHFLPWLLSMHSLGHCSAVAGLRSAARGGLFLEQYLDHPVERQLSAFIGARIPRPEIVEVGNLAAGLRGASRVLFLVMTAALHASGYKWIVFTATRSLRTNLDKLDFPLHILAEASPRHLDDAALAEWGRYYDSDPLVMAGSLDLAMQLISERPLLRRVMRPYLSQINLLVEALGKA